MKQTRRLIDPNDPDLPENIYATKGDSWEEALWRIEKNLKQAPKNAGHFTNTAFHPSVELETLITRLINDGRLDEWDYGFTCEADVDNLLALAFNDMAFDAVLNDQETTVLDELKGYLSDVVKPLLNVWPGETRVNMQFRPRERTIDSWVKSSHVDLGQAGKSKDWAKEAFNDVSFYVLLPMNSVGTAFHDIKNIVSEGTVTEVKAGGLKSHFDPVANSGIDDLWYAQPWSTSVMASHIWTHMPPMHTQPPTINHQPERRATVFMAVDRL